LCPLSGLERTVLKLYDNCDEITMFFGEKNTFILFLAMI